MKFIHMADMHLDCAFQTLANNSILAQERRLEQRQVMKQIVEYIKQNNIPYFFIAGDLYEQEYIKKSTIEYINNLFQQIPNTKIFITPGNHDPYIKNSFYKQYNWSKNVFIFTSNLQCIECEDVDIYGYGFNDFYMENNYHEIPIKNKNKINILITHGNLDSGADEQKAYNPLTSKELKKLEFDYIALGHIHKKSYNDYPNQKIVYPGSTISIGFDELGPRGVIQGEINNKTKELNTQFIPIEAKTFEEQTINISDLNSEEDLIEEINTTNFDENKYYKIILTGKRSFSLSENQILELVKKPNILKIKNHTQAKYDINEISTQTSLKGLFAKRILEQINTQTNPVEQQKLLKAFEIGIDILNK